MTLENMDRDINALIAKLHADERIHKSSHFSSTRYNDEPIIFTGRQMSSYMPDRYREMRAISRWQEGANGGRGRWLSEDESSTFKQPSWPISKTIVPTREPSKPTRPRTTP